MDSGSSGSSYVKCERTVVSWKKRRDFYKSFLFYLAGITCIIMEINLLNERQEMTDITEHDVHDNFRSVCVDIAVGAVSIYIAQKMALKALESYAAYKARKAGR